MKDGRYILKNNYYVDIRFKKLITINGSKAENCNPSFVKNCKKLINDGQYKRGV